jgi:3-methyladenine DNA glycosylase AlkC
MCDSLSEHLLYLNLEVYGDRKFEEWLSIKATEFYERYRDDETITDEQYNILKKDLEKSMNKLVDELRSKGYDEKEVTFSQAYKIIENID